MPAITEASPPRLKRWFTEAAEAYLRNLELFEGSPLSKPVRDLIDPPLIPNKPHFFCDELEEL